MFLRLTRILMNAVDGGSGNGAAPQPTQGAPTAPPAPTGAQPSPAPQPAPTQGESDEYKRGRDAAYAELRRSGALKKKYVENQDGTGKPAGKPGEPLDPASYRRLDRALNRSGRASGLDDRAYARLERDYAAEAPDDADAWITDYFKSFGVSAAPAAPASGTDKPTTQQPRTPVPVTAGAAPHAPQQGPTEERDLITLSQTDIEHLVKTKGLRWYTETLRTQLKNKRFKVTG